MTAANEAVSTETPATVTFDTLKAVQELRKTGFEDRQAEAIVSTISKAMSETVATKADLELQSAVTKADLELQSAVTKADIEAMGAELKAETGALRTEFKLFRQSVDSRFEQVALRFDALENRIILKLGGLIVTMTFLLLAIGPFYFRWVLSLMGTS